MTFFKGLFKVLSAAGAVALVNLLSAVKEYFASAQPSDVNSMIWAALAFAAVLGLNFLIGKIKLPA